MAGKILTRKGTVIGYEHRNKGKNNQDSLVCPDKPIVIEGKEHFLGIVLDGCSGDIKKSQTEVGSRLLGTFAASEIPLILHSHVPIDQVPDVLYQRMVGYVGQVAKSTVVGDPQVVCDFILNTFLCTVVGFLMDGDRVVTFTAGDGALIVNDQTIAIEEDNTPRYLAYHQVDRRILGKAATLLPKTFATQVYSRSEIQRIAVCTDGVLKSRSSEWRFDPNELFNYERGVKGGVQWLLNGYGETSLVSDDTTVVTWEQFPS